MSELILYKPKLEELSFRQSLLADPETMAYNHAYGGTIAVPQHRWADWYARWVEDETGARFYRFLRCEPSGQLVGNVSYHYDEAFGAFLCEVLVAAQYRGKGFGQQGLELLCAAAKQNGVKKLCDDIASDNPAVELFRRTGFQERLRTDEYILMEKEL